MAEAKTQNLANEQRRSEERGERGLARHGEFPSRDLFGLSPFSMMRRLTEEMDRAFASSLGLTRGSGGVGMWAPPIEVREHGNALEITAELPGMSKDDIKIQCTEEGIVIEGEKRREKESTEGGVHRSERSYGHFCRTVPLPEGTDPEKAKADFKDGILHIQVPLSEQHRKVRQIPIGT